MKHLNFALAALVGIEAVTGQTQEQKDKYPAFATEMEAFGGYAWEPFEVTTDDGYILTVFHMMLEGEHSNFSPSTLFSHGYGLNWATVFRRYREGLEATEQFSVKPLYMNLVD